MDATRKIGLSSLVGLAFSMLIAHWKETSTVLEIVYDLMNQNRGDSSIFAGIEIQYFFLLSFAILSALLFMWFTERNVSGNILLIIVSFTGILLTISLQFQGARLLATTACSLSFLGMVFSGFRNIAEKIPDRQNVSSVLPSLWKKSFSSAILQGIPISIISIITPSPLNKQEISSLSKELRTNDLIAPVEDGLVILLWNTNIEKAQLVSCNIIKLLSTGDNSLISIGISGLPEDGDTLSSLINNANIALDIAKASYKKKIVLFRELIFPPEIKELFHQNTPNISEYLIRLQGVWDITEKKGWPLTALLFSLGNITDEPIILSYLQKWLRGIDEVGVLNHGKILAVLLNTTVEGCNRLRQKLLDLFTDLARQNIIQPVEIIPVTKIDKAKDFSGFIRLVIDR